MTTPGSHVTEDIGVVVGRFQTPMLHEGHKELLSKVASNHKRVVVFLGVSQNKRSRRNPLDFEARKIMILQTFPEFTVLPLSDMQDDQVWSHQLDAKIREAFPFASVRLYGGRDSFIAHYLGSLPTTEIESTIYHSATLLRDDAGHDVKASPEWRAGVIYGAYNQFPKVWATVDVAPVRRESDGTYSVLLARKPNEKSWRFIGGFSDPTDKSFEHAAKREVREEAHIEIEAPEWVGSCRINDWRYKDDVDKVITNLFATTYIFGHPTPDDDIEELKWFKINDWNHVPMVVAHQELQNMFLSHATKKGWYHADTVKGKPTQADGQL